MSSFDSQLKAFKDEGYVVLENAFSADLIDKIREEFLAANTFENGFKRKLVSVDVKGSINTSDFLFNPAIIQFIEKILNPLYVIESVLAPVTGPGSEMQHKHSDGGGTYGEKYDLMLPAHAVGLMIPLIDMDSTTGTTRVWAGSQINPGREEYVDLQIKKGSCFLIDTRILHAGTPNISNALRPMIYITYSFPWYINYIDFRDIPCFKMSDAEINKWDDKTKNRFVRRNIQAGLK